MRSAVAALAWEFWGANRRGWLCLLAAIPVCAIGYRILAGPLGQSEALRSMCFLPLVMSLILAAAFCNFTDRSRRNGMAGFPQHLFTLPVSTLLSVSCVMSCAVLSLVGIYVAWAKLVYEPVGIQVLVRWPATLIATGVVASQAAVWCLSGLPLTRIIVLSLLATTLVGLGLLPYVYSDTGDSQLERNLTASVAVFALVAYAAALTTVGLQRRGGARGWTWIQNISDYLTIRMPRRRSAIRSADAALFWIEWRRTGFILPAAVVFTMILILGPAIWFTGRGPKETFWAETWLAMLPFFLSAAIGMGFAKPDFWSLELSLSPFVASRPVTGSHLVAAKMKAAACSTLLTWAVLLIVAPICIYLYCDTEHWREAWRMTGLVYSPVSRWAVPILSLASAIFITWSLMVGNIWLGYSGRAGFYYSFVAIGLGLLIAAFFYFIWWLDHPHNRGDALVRMLPWLPWMLSAAVIVKVWLAAFCVHRSFSRSLIGRQSIALYAFIWLVATSCLLLCAWLMSPRIEWVRNVLMLAALCTIPAARVAAAPLTIVWNRHR
jgi:hypothetical protein